MIYILALILFPVLLQGEIYLKQQLSNSKKGDFVVTMQQKDLTVWHIQDRSPTAVLIEEVTVPCSRAHLPNNSWKEWFQKKCPCHTSWLVYTLDMKTGKLLSYYDVDQQRYLSVKMEDPFLTTLLNLPFYEVPLNGRKRVGSFFDSPDDPRTYWQPPMIVDGVQIENVFFDHYRTAWPHDRTQLSGKTVDIFLPKPGSPYPTYFPYWLQISGGVGKARLRIVDTGSGMESIIPPMWPLQSG